MNFWDMYHCLLLTSLIKENSKQWYMSQKFMANVPYKRKQQTMVHVPEVHDKHELLGHVPLFAIFFYKGRLS
jgi:hypothetical protein